LAAKAKELSMRLRVDTSAVRFMVTKGGEAKWDRDANQQKVDRASGALLWELQLMALDESGGEIIKVTLDTEPKFSVGEFVQVEDLVAIPWSQGDRSGVAFRARVTSASGAKSADVGKAA
jgi:hypothetical protein